MSDESEIVMSRVFLGGLVLLIAILVFALTDADSGGDEGGETRESAGATTKSKSGKTNVVSSKTEADVLVAQGAKGTGVRATSQKPKSDNTTDREQANGESASLKRPYRVAASSLKALKDGSFESLLMLVPPSRVESVRERWGPGTVRYEELFGSDSWQQRSVQSWTGELVGLRVKRNVQALVKYGEIVEDGITKHLCVSLLNIEGDGNWYFKDLDARPDDSYVDYGDAVKFDYVSPKFEAVEPAPQGVDASPTPETK